MDRALCMRSKWLWRCMGGWQAINPEAPEAVHERGKRERLQAVHLHANSAVRDVLMYK